MKTLYRISLILQLLYVVVVSTALGQAKAILDPVIIPKFQNELPVIKQAGLRVDLTKGGSINVQIVETQQDLLGLGTLTKVWGYKFPGLPTSYPGATIVAQQGKAVTVRWENNLPTEYDDFPHNHLLPVDHSIHMAHPMAMTGVPTVTHLHGGHTESASDGLPEAWFTRNFSDTGKDFVKTDYRYDNDQEAATLWYHDHALGITRLNVYAGLAGFYLLRDRNENNLINAKVLPSGDYEIEIVIQDRLFDAIDHQLYYPAVEGDEPYEEFIFGEEATPPPGPSILAEFFGNVILVNGKAWPRLSVEPRKYRIRLLNGSDSRAYVLSFLNELPWFQTATDDGLLPAAINIPDPLSEPGRELTIAPGERMDLILDFTGKSGQEFVLYNYGPDGPFGGDYDLDLTRPTAQIMKFVVDKPLSALPDASVAVGTKLRATALPPIPTTHLPAQQSLVLFEGSDEYGRLQPLLGTLSAGSLPWLAPVTENPKLNETQVWEFFNATMDAHPIHLHLVAFQVLGRGAFTADVRERDQEQHNGNVATGGGRDFQLISRDSWRGPEENEIGWKDTHLVYPGEYSQVRARFDRPGMYAWHCHILSHEDHEMMRPFFVGPMRAKKRATQMSIAAAPNPLTTTTTIQFETPEAVNLRLSITDLFGATRYRYSGSFEAGKNAILWDGVDEDGRVLPNGLYYYKLEGDGVIFSDRLLIKR